MREQPLVLIIDGDTPAGDRWQEALSERGWTVETTTDDDTGHQAIERLHPDVVLVHPSKDCEEGHQAIVRVQRLDPSIAVVMICGDATVRHAVEAMKLGAAEFVAEPPSPTELVQLVDRALRTRSHHLEQQAVEREREQVRSQFISIVSHEMRSPLLFIKQCLQLLSDGDVGRIDDEAKSVLQSAGNRLEVALELVSDWLTLARINSADVLGDAEPVEVAGALHEAAETVRAAADARGITIEVEDVPPDLRVKADADNLRLILTNLVENAVKYNRTGGSVKVKSSTSDGTVAISVTDTGIGIAEDALPFVFDEFFRSKTQETLTIHGTGLGLSIVKRIVEGYGGEIRAESEEGQGSTFVVSLPRA
jgi:signal transduction histidine kinase